jgi:hypothetical protein
MSALEIFRSDLKVKIQQDDQEIEVSFWELSWKTIDTFCPSIKGDFDDILAKTMQHN